MHIYSGLRAASPATHVDVGTGAWYAVGGGSNVFATIDSPHRAQDRSDIQPDAFERSANSEPAERGSYMRQADGQVQGNESHHLLRCVAFFVSRKDRQ